MTQRAPLLSSVMREQLDVHQAAAYLGLSERAFRRLVHDGLIVNTEGKRGAWRSK